MQTLYDIVHSKNRGITTRLIKENNTITRVTTFNLPSFEKQMFGLLTIEVRSLIGEKLFLPFSDELYTITEIRKTKYDYVILGKSEDDKLCEVSLNKICLDTTQFNTFRSINTTLENLEHIKKMEHDENDFDHLLLLKPTKNKTKEHLKLSLCHKVVAKFNDRQFFDYCYERGLYIY